MANGRRENRPSKNQLLVITFVGAIEFDVERAKLNYNIGMPKSNVKTTSPEKHLLFNEDRVMPVGGREQD